MSTRLALPLAALVAALAFGPQPASAASVLLNNQGTITIPSQGTASPYPSSVTAQGVPGRITDIVVTLRGFAHPRPSEVDILLVSPSGNASIVMSDSCGFEALTNATFAFSDAFAQNMTFAGPCDGFFYRPTDLARLDPDSFGPNAPPGPYTASLDRFVGEDPNGQWRLFVVDDTKNDGGKIANGWTLGIETAVPDAVLPKGDGSMKADPYPIKQTVSGVSGVITDLDVSLSGIYHERPADIDMLLVGPQGRTVMLMSDTCGVARAKNLALTLDDEATGPLPAGPYSCTSGASYRPTDAELGDQLPAEAPQGLFPNALTTFDSTDPNGEWRLYVADDDPGSADGFLTERFKLDIKTRPKAKAAFATAGIDITEGETQDLTVVRPAEGRSLGPGAVTVASSPLTAASATDFKPILTTLSFDAGQTQKSIPLQALADDLPEDTETFALTLGQTIDDVEKGTPSISVVTIHDPARPDPATAPSQAAPADPPAPAGDERDAGPALRVDRDAPVIGGVALTRNAIRYTLSEAATVTLTLQRRAGRRFVTDRTLRRTGLSGANRVALRALRRGAYRVVVTAVDAAGNRATAPVRGFRIKGGRHA